MTRIWHFWLHTVVLTIVCINASASAQSLPKPQILKAQNSGPIHSIAFSPDGQTIAATSDKGQVQLWNAATGKLRRVLSHNSDVYGVAFSPDGNTLAVGKHDNEIRMWNPNTAQKKMLLKHPGEDLNHLAFSPNGQLLATGNHNGTVRIWEVATGHLRYQFRLDEWLSSVVFSPDGKTVAAGAGDGVEGDDPGAIVKIWDIHTGKLRHTIIDHIEFLQSLAFAPDGKTLAIGSGERISFWNPDTGRIRWIASTKNVATAIAYSPTNTWLADTTQTYAPNGDPTICHLEIWEIKTHHRLKNYRLTTQPNALVVSPHNRLVAIGCEDGTIEIWTVSALVDR